MAWQIIFGRLALVWQIIKHRPNLVLLDSYVEYLSPFWVWPHWLLARIWRVKYAANLHDPVRNYASVQNGGTSFRFGWLIRHSILYWCMTNYRNHRLCLRMSAWYKYHTDYMKSAGHW